MQKNGAESFGICQVPSATARTSRSVAFVTAHSSIPGRRKLLSPFQDSQHTPPIFLVQRLRFVVYWRCVLKTPPKSIFFLPSIPLSFQPLFRAGILRKIPGYWACRTPPFFCDSVSPVCRRSSKFLNSKHGQAVFSVSSPRTVVCQCSKYSHCHTTVFSIPFPHLDCPSIER